MIGQATGVMVSFIARYVFINTLGSVYLGISGLFTNILSILSLAELGVGAAIVYSLYKPLAEEDHLKVKALMNLYKKAYITIGIIIAVGGIIITPFLQFFVKDFHDISNLKFIFLLFVTNASISYFFAYKRSLIIADQKRYIATLYRYSFFVGLNIVQIVILLSWKNYILFLILQIIFTFMENLAVSKKADNIYPYIKTDSKVALDINTKREISKNVKAMVGHKVGGVIVNGTDNILIAKIFGVILVGVYSNYLLILNSINIIVSMLFQAVLSSIGNLAVSESKGKTREIFYSINLIGFWIYGLISICLSFLLIPFLNLWIGLEYTFSLGITIILIINFYINGMRKSVLTFRDAMGLFWYDRHKPYFEIILNLILSIVFAQRFGLVGVFLGTTLSTMIVCFWVEPYILFKYGFKSEVRPYFINYIKFFLILSGTYISIWYVSSLIGLNITTWFQLIAFTVFLLIFVNIVFLLLFRRTKEFKYLYSVFKPRLNFLRK